MNVSPRPRYIVIIPAYNEAPCIRQTIAEVQRALPEADIVVIDDGSSDKTTLLARQAGAWVVRHPFNLCIGGAVSTGLKFALRGRYELIMRVDGDGQHNARELHKLMAALQTAKVDAVFGSRFLDPARKFKVPLMRRIGIVLYARLVTLLTGQRATDTTSGFFCMNRRAATILAAHLPQDYPEVEGRVLLHRGGAKVLEVPVQMRERLSGVSSINHWRSLYYALKVSLAVLLTVWKQLPSAAEFERAAALPVRSPLAGSD